MGKPPQGYGASITCHVGSHSVTCNPMQVNVTRHKNVYYMQCEAIYY